MRWLLLVPLLIAPLIVLLLLILSSIGGLLQPCNL
jgi:hypothetical protein